MTSTETRLITAYFDDKSAASSAVQRLRALGVPDTQVRLTEGAEGADTGQAAEHSSGGFWDALADFLMPEEDRYTYAEGLRRGGYLVTAQVDDRQYERALDILDDDGTIDISEREQAWRSEGWSGYEESGGTEQAIPVTEEQLRVGKRDVSHGRVRVRSYVVEQPVHESVSLHEEHVDVERRPVDRPVQATDDAFRERSVEVDEHSEEAVVSKEARVTEEVVVRKDSTERTEDIDDTVRRTEVDVEDERLQRRNKAARR